jgi:hypothetical protein
MAARMIWSLSFMASIVLDGFSLRNLTENGKTIRKDAIAR